MTEMFGEAWPPMSAPDLAPDDDDDILNNICQRLMVRSMDRVYKDLSFLSLVFFFFFGQKVYGNSPIIR